MKKNILELTFLIIIGSLALASCSNEKKTESHEGHEQGTEVASSQYFCPMKCERRNRYQGSRTSTKWVDQENKCI